MSVTQFAPLARAQAGDTSGVTYPNWKRADLVLPTILLAVRYDSVASLWRYEFTITNGSSAAQDVNKLDLSFNGPLSALTAPAGWDTASFPPPAIRPGAVFSTISSAFVTVSGGTAAAPTPHQIRPGASVAGFGLVSRYPPGEARSVVRGYAAVPFLPDSVDEEFEYPDDTTNAQRGWTLAPTRYTRIITQGTHEATDLSRAERFLSFMNVDTAGTTLRAPAVIAIKFDDGADGDFVLRETFRAFLNDVDVTSLFHPGPSDGADRVAVFMIGEGAPLLAGANTLKTVVGGLPSTISTSAVPSIFDTDVIHFTVQP